MSIINELKVNPNNPRTLSKTQYEKLKKSLKEFPQMLDLRPIVYDENGIVLGGNMRLRVLQELQSEMEIKDSWFKKAEELTEDQKREFIIKDNVEFGDWDTDILANEWSDLPLDDWGIDTDDWEKEVEEDEAPEVDETSEPISKLGEVYQLGRHRLMCGDSTKIEDVEKLMNEQKAEIVAIIDPPYGISLVKDGKVGADFGVAKKGVYEPIMGDGDINIARQAFDILATITDRMVIFGGNYFLDFLPASDGWLIWDKRGDTGIRNTFADGEMAWCSFHTPVRIYKQLWNGMIREGEHDKRVHPTQKPVRLLTDIIKDFTNEGDIVLDLFGGSGSTLIACEQLNRTCYMMELDPKYCDVIRKRYAKFIGKESEWEKITPQV